MNKKHQNTLVVRADVIMPGTIRFGDCKELERLSGKKVLAKGKDERDTILTRPVNGPLKNSGMNCSHVLLFSLAARRF